MNMPAKESGMNFIMACCCGSVVVIGVIFVARYIEAAMTTGKM